MPDKRYKATSRGIGVVLVVPGDHQTADHHELDTATAERLIEELNSAILNVKNRNGICHAMTPNSVAQHMAEAVDHIRAAEIAVRANPGMFSDICEFLEMHNLETRARSLLIGFMGGCSLAHDSWFRTNFPKEHAEMNASRIEEEQRRCAPNPTTIESGVMQDIDATE